MDAGSQWFEVIAWFIPALGLAVITFLATRGCFTEAALEKGPDRGVGLGAADLGLGLLLMLAGMIGAGVVLGGFTEPGDTGVQAPDTLARVLTVLLGQALAQGPAAIFFLLRAGRAENGLRRVGVGLPAEVSILRWCVKGTLSALPIVMGVLVVSAAVGEAVGKPAPRLAHPLLVTLAGSDSPLATALLLASAVGVAPVLEELVFRGLVQTSIGEVLGPGRRWTTILLAAAFFTVLHTVNWHALPALLALGIILGWVYERTGTLWPCIAIHAVFNALNVAIVLLAAGAPPA